MTVVLISLHTHHPVAFSRDGWPGPNHLRMLTKTIGAIFRFQVNSLRYRTSQGQRARQKRAKLDMWL